MMLEKLTVDQYLTLAAIAFVWCVILLWICLHKPKKVTDDRFSRFMEWRIYQNKPLGTVDDWVGTTSEHKGPVGGMSQLRLAWAWTGIVSVVTTLLLFEWTKIV
jgi:hypothetical protein